jgi:hypothetical protein
MPKFGFLLSYLTCFSIFVQTSYQMSTNQNGNKIKIGVYYGSDPQYESQYELKKLTVEYTIRKLNQFYSPLGMQFESKIVSLSAHNSFKALKYGLKLICNFHFEIYFILCLNIQFVMDF